MAASETKGCLRCKVTKPTSSFTQGRRICKECLKRQNVEIYHRRKSHYINLLGGVCVDCGSTDSLQFDHIDPSTKKFNITSKILGYLYDVDEEIKKCVLRCELCHRIKSNKEILGRPKPRDSGLKAKIQPHDTLKRYKQGCRCDRCRSVHASYKKYMRKIGHRVGQSDSGFFKQYLLITSGVPNLINKSIISPPKLRLTQTHASARVVPTATETT